MVKTKEKPTSYAGFTINRNTCVYIDTDRNNCEESEYRNFTDSLIAKNTNRNDFHYRTTRIRLSNDYYGPKLSDKYVDVFKTDAITVQFDNKVFKDFIINNQEYKAVLHSFGHDSDAKLGDKIFEDIKLHLDIPKDSILYSLHKKRPGHKEQGWGIRELYWNDHCQKLAFIINDFKFLPGKDNDTPICEAIGKAKALKGMVLNSLAQALISLEMCKTTDDIHKPKLTSQSNVFDIAISDYKFLDKMTELAKQALTEALDNYQGGELKETLTALSVDFDKFKQSLINKIIKSSAGGSYHLYMQFDDE